MSRLDRPQGTSFMVVWCALFGHTTPQLSLDKKGHLWQLCPRCGKVW